MKKKMFFGLLMVLIICITTACFEQKTASITYHPSYIDVNKGKRWFYYGILYANAYNGSQDGTLSVLVQNKYDEEYGVLFIIDNDYYNERDIIVATNEYIYLFNQNNKITAYKLTSKKQEPIIINHSKLEKFSKIYGASNDYIFVSYDFAGKEMYLKISSDLSKSYNIDNIDDILNQIKYAPFGVSDLK